MLKSDINQSDLTKSQIKKVHDKIDDLPKDSFRDRYKKKQGQMIYKILKIDCIQDLSNRSKKKLEYKRR